MNCPVCSEPLWNDGANNIKYCPNCKIDILDWHWVDGRVIYEIAEQIYKSTPSYYFYGDHTE